MDLPFWFRVAVGPAEISARFRGETVSNGLQATGRGIGRSEDTTQGVHGVVYVCARSPLLCPRGAARGRAYARAREG